MSRGVDEVEDVFLLIIYILHLYGMALDGDAAFFLEVHVVEHLSLCHLDGVSVFEEAVGECTLAVVDMSYDTEVTYVFH